MCRYHVIPKAILQQLSLVAWNAFTVKKEKLDVE